MTVPATEWGVQFNNSPVRADTKMHSRLMHTLALAGGLLLALPPGWCCMVGPWGSAQKAGSRAAVPASCCGQCGSCCRTSQVPVEPAGPAPPQAPLPPAKCPCGDRHATAPDGPKVVTGDLVLLAPPTIESAPAWCASERIVLSPVFYSDLSLQVLHRVWLC